MYNEECNGVSYKAIQHLADELAVKNMIDVLKWDVMFTREEQSKIIEALKAHTLMNAEMMLEKAENGVISSNEKEYKR